jgi:hypothetical protein
MPAPCPPACMQGISSPLFFPYPSQRSQTPNHGPLGSPPPTSPNSSASPSATVHGEARPLRIARRPASHGFARLPRQTRQPRPSPRCTVRPDPFGSPPESIHRRQQSLARRPASHGFPRLPCQTRQPRSPPRCTVRPDPFGSPTPSDRRAAVLATVSNHGFDQSRPYPQILFKGGLDGLVVISISK